VAATNKNLAECVKKGLFRDDLFYRINVVKLCIPPLRNRKEDIPLLVDHFIRKLNNLNNKDIQGLKPDVLPVLMAYDYPGNVRELENIVEYASVVCKDRQIGVDHLPEHLFQTTGPQAVNRNQDGHFNNMTFDDMERRFLSDRLRKNRWNRKTTAEEMGIHPTTLWRKMKRLNIEIPNRTHHTKKRSKP
jgi:transcriptional regulator with PAS, ATPase and Fis domain